MTKKKVIVQIREGIDVEHAKELAAASERFECRAWLEWNGNEINMRSLLNLVAVGITKGKEVTVVCDGEDETAAADCLEEILARKQS